MFPIATLQVAQRFFEQLDMTGCELNWNRIKEKQPLSRDALVKLTDQIQTIHEHGLENNNIPDSIEFVEDILHYLIIGSRLRVLVRIVTLLSGFKKKRPDFQELSKIQQLILACCATVNDVLLDLQKVFCKYSSSFKLNDPSARKFNDYLLTCYTASVLFGNRMKFIKGEDSMQDLTKLGIANTYSLNRDESYFKIREQIVVLALYYYVRESDQVFTYQREEILDKITNIVENLGLNAARGSYFEHLVFQALLRNDFQGLLIQNLPFVHKVLGKQTVPEWCKKTKFVVNHIHLNRINTGAFVKQNPQTLCSPETTARFDGIVLLDQEENHCMTFAVTMWTDNVPSTDPSLAYFKTDQ